MAVGDIEKKCAGSVRHIDGAFAGELEADKILGQQNVGDALPVARLILAHPKKLGQGEIGERGLQVS